MKEKINQIAEEILSNAFDYIGNKKDFFGADSIALHTISNSKNFRQFVIDEIDGSEDEYEEEVNNQEAAANFVWKMYMRWAYGDVNYAT